MDEQTITPEDEQRIIAAFQDWLKEKWKDHPCPICGVDSWEISGTGQIHSYGRGAWGGNGQHYPLGVVRCQDCGYIALFGIRGILPDDVTTPQTPEDAAPEEAGP